MNVLIFKQTKDSDLSTGMKVAFKDTHGEYTQIGTIGNIEPDEHGIQQYEIAENGCLYLASELKLLDSGDLNDWSRWNTGLPEGQKVEISEDIYDDLLNCLPPHRWEGSYFEVGEPHHHHPQTGRAVYRACWKEGNKFYTGYPKTK